MSIKTAVCLLTAAGLVAACGKSPQPAAAGPQTAAPLASGIEAISIDRSVRPQDDFYKYVNGRWLANTQIPADKGSYGNFDSIGDTVQEQLRAIVEGLQKQTDPADPDQRKIADLYASFMDEPALDALGMKSLDAELAKVDALKSGSDLAALIAHFNELGVSAPFTPAVHHDARDSTRYVFDLGQDGLGLPDRDYYLQNDQKLKKIRTQYRQHVEAMLKLAGDTSAGKNADLIMVLETRLAKAQWTKVENRDPVKIYNKVELAKLAGITASYDWQRYLTASGVQGRTDYLIVSQPSYIAGFGRLLKEMPLPAWKTYFRWRLINDYAPYLGKDFVDLDFAFYGTALRDVPQNKPRWKRGIELVSQSIGEGLGRIYVARHFPPQSKARMDLLVKNLLTAYKADIDTLDWMGPETKQKAQAKLAKFNTKIGYPVRWRDYGALQIARGDLVGDVIRARQFEYNRNLNKLGKPIDRDEWGMTPQRVNAYYDPELNEIVFPAAILQPPFFNAAADDAVNYGAIGGVIGHEISHGFDDEGSQYDGDGNLLNPPGWFTQADLDRFKARGHAMVKQYSAYAPVPGYPVNGELTLGENIADNSGLATAYKAYRLSLGGATAPVIDGFTGDQRFFIGWGQAWRSKTRDNQAILWVKSDPHSPDEVRGTVPEMNQAAFQQAFEVKPTDTMYLAPEQRVTLW